MRRRAGVGLLGGLLAIAGGCGRELPPEERSVVLVTLDTTRADRLGPYGGRAVPTPNFDRFAREGVVFDLAMSQVPLTLPSHASIFTGRYPSSHGVRHNGIYRLREDETTLAERLRDAGWDTAAFTAAFVVNRGFGLEQGFATYDDVPVNRYEGGHDVVFEAQRSADDVNAAVARWLAGRPAGKRFVWVHYYDPHDPYAPPEVPGRTLQGTGYDREISYVDACFGDLLRRLDEADLLDRSIVVVAGDHGESLGEHGEKTHGIFLYESVMRVPLLMRAPGLLPAGKRIGGPVELVDVAPTVLDLLSLPPLPSAQGRSLRDRIEGRDDGRGALAHAETLMPRIEFGWSELRAVRDGRFRYVEAPRAELYDLRADPGETRNLAPNDDERAKEMAGALAAWVGATTDAAAEQASSRALAPDEEAKLRSLGYLAGGDTRRSDPAAAGLRVDPKDGIAEVRRLDEARDRLAAGDVAAALEGASAVLAANPSNHQARTTKILALLEARRFVEAEDAAMEALAAAERDPEASMVLVTKARGLLASAYRLAGKRAEAESVYRTILARDPDQASAAIDLARLLLESGRGPEAAPLIEGVLARDPKNGMALAARFLAERDRGDAAAALTTARAIADVRAGDPDTVARAGRVLLEAGDFPRAAACFEAALEGADALDPSLLGQLGTARLNEGKLEEAKRAFAAVAQLRPADPRPVYHLGVVALRAGDEREARLQFDRALRLDARFAAPLTTLGRWLAAKGRRAEAEETLRRALERDPGDAAARQALEGLGASPTR